MCHPQCNGLNDSALFITDANIYASCSLQMCMHKGKYSNVMTFPAPSTSIHVHMKRAWYIHLYQLWIEQKPLIRCTIDDKLTIIVHYSCVGTTERNFQNPCKSAGVKRKRSCGECGLSWVPFCKCLRPWQKINNSFTITTFRPLSTTKNSYESKTKLCQRTKNTKHCSSQLLYLPYCNHIAFLGKSVNLPIAMGMPCSSVCVCLSVYVRIVRTGQILTKIKKCKKITFIDFDTCNLPVTLPVLYSVTLTYFFKVIYFKCQYLENGKR